MGHELKLSKQFYTKKCWVCSVHEFLTRLKISFVYTNYNLSFYFRKELRNNFNWNCFINLNWKLKQFLPHSLKLNGRCSILKSSITNRSTIRLLTKILKLFRQIFIRSHGSLIFLNPRRFRGKKIKTKSYMFLYLFSFSNDLSRNVSVSFNELIFHWK